MKRSVQLVVASLALALVVLGGIGSCQQQEGERCQVDEDCAEGKCNQGEGVCRSNVEGEIIDFPPPFMMDAAVDASDAAPADAPTDSM
jgi:hypothetical protein